MITFLLKGILRDKGRSLLPIIIIAIGVFLTIFMSTWVSGILNDTVDLSARFTTGHVKIMTRAYAENAAQNPNDLALLDVGELKQQLAKEFPEMEWVDRIRFGGLIDVPDSKGETKTQGPAVGQAIDFLSSNTTEPERLNILQSLRQGRAPQARGEALLSDDFANQLGVHPGDEVTLFGSTMEGSMAFHNFQIVGTVSFGSSVLDKGSILIDIEDAREALDMADAAGEVLGYFKNGKYDDAKAQQIATAFNASQSNNTDEFAPTMLRLKEQNNLMGLLDASENMRVIMVSFFVFAMSIVLWNTGLLGGLRRYSEVGIRLALGEPKVHIYKTMIYESILIGIIGTVIGTVIGLSLSYYVQKYGIDFGDMMKSSSMMLPSVFRTLVSPQDYFIGFIPGVFSMVLGTALSGIGIFKRNTAQLFKEMEV